jgi:hypothetical protein
VRGSKLPKLRNKNDCQALSNGIDLPSLLPRSARRPAPRCFPTLRTDIDTALDAASRTSRGQVDAADRRALRWALKRCIRAAYERTHLLEAADAIALERVEDGELPEGVEADATSANGARLAERGYTRDLFHCTALAAAARPQWEPDLAAALAATVLG